MRSFTNLRLACAVALVSLAHGVTTQSTVASSSSFDYVIVGGKFLPYLTLCNAFLSFIQVARPDSSWQSVWQKTATQPSWFWRLVDCGWQSIKPYSLTNFKLWHRPSENPLTSVPAGFLLLADTAVWWNYTTVPQSQLLNRTVVYPGGHVLGGGRCFIL